MLSANNRNNAFPLNECRFLSPNRKSTEKSHRFRQGNKWATIKISKRFVYSFCLSANKRRHQSWNWLQLYHFNTFGERTFFFTDCLLRWAFATVLRVSSGQTVPPAGSCRDVFFSFDCLTVKAFENDRKTAAEHPTIGGYRNVVVCVHVLRFFVALFSSSF